MNTLTFLFVILNFAISWFNAWSVGRAWNETKRIGGFARFMSWCVAIQSASGFTWCFVVIGIAINQVFPEKYILPHRYQDATMALGYLTVIIPIIFTGTAMTIQSWVYFWRERSFKNGAIAGWNTFADIYNVYHAIRDIPECFSMIENVFSSDKDDEDRDLRGILLLIVIAIVVLAISGGILLTSVIIRRTARGAAQEHTKRVNSAQGMREQYA